MYKYATDLSIGASVLTTDDRVGTIVDIVPAWTRTLNPYRVEYKNGETKSFASCELFQVGGYPDAPILNSTSGLCAKCQKAAMYRTRQGLCEECA